MAVTVLGHIQDTSKWSCTTQLSNSSTLEKEYKSFAKIIKTYYLITLLDKSSAVHSALSCFVFRTSTV